MEHPQEEKPPLGLMPENIWIEKRIYEIVAAIDRYRNADKDIPKEWMKELRNHLNQFYFD